MKKLLLTLSLSVLLTSISTFAQTVLYQQVFNTPTFPATMTRIDNDGFTIYTPYQTLFGGTTASWAMFIDSISPTVDDTCVISTSWFNTAATASDWIITPAISVTGSNPVLSWNARAIDDAPYNDGYEVRIGTSPTIAALTTVLYTNAGENKTWTSRNVSLNSYIGQTVYIAIVNNSNDRNILLLDDIAVVAGGAPINDIALTSPIRPSEYSSIPLSQVSGNWNLGVSVTNNGNVTATGVSVNLSVRELIGNTVVNTQTLSGPSSVNAGATSAYTQTTAIPKGAVGFYEFRYVCSMTPVDANRTNDTIFRYVAIDSELYARDEALTLGTITNTLGVPGSTVEVAQKYSLSNITNIKIDTVFAFFGENRVGARYRAKVYTASGNNPSVLIATGNTRTITTADTVGGVGVIGLTFPTSLIPPAIGEYFVSIEQMDTFNYGLGYNANIATAGSASISSPVINGGAWTASSAAGFPGAYIIWPQLLPASPTCNLGVTATGSNPTCGASNGGVNTNVTGATATPTFLWSNGATTANITGLTPGTYTVTVTSGSCTATATATLSNVGTTPTFTTSSTNSNCAASTGSASVVGAPAGSTFSWSTTPVQSSATASNIPAGTYTVTVTNTGCTATASVTVNNPAPPSFTTSSTSSSCGSATGSASVNGAPMGSTYAWSTTPAQSTATASNIAAGIYTVTVTNAGCTATASVTVNNPNAPSVTATPINPTCFGGANGSATANGLGGTGTLSYTWSNGQSGVTASGLTAGVYTVTVRDGASCQSSFNVTVTNPSQITTSVSSTSVNCFGGNNGTASVTAGGGTGNLSYNWNSAPAQASSTATNLPAGSYTVTVTDQNACSVTASVSVTQPSAALSGSIVPTSVNCFGGSTGSAIVTPAGGTPNYGFAWSNGQTSATLSNVTSGTYTVTITDSKNCTATATTTITQPAAALNVTTQTTANTAIANVSGGTSPYNYVWSTTPAQTIATATGLTPGTYSVTVTDQKGCSATATVTITSIKDIEAAGISAISLYPNPSAGFATIKAELAEASTLSIEISDTKGKVVMTQELGAGLAIERAITLNQLASGVYVVKYITNSGTATQRLIIQ